ncbi:MAG TPA: amidohydrolase family protein [Bacteroidales bacterium]
MKIDSHQHFWIYKKEEYSWMCGGMETIMKDHMPPQLDEELRKAGFSGSVAVQARQSIEETEWLLKLADRYDIIKGVVGWVDLQSSNLEEQLKKYSKHPRFVGVRHVVQDEPESDFILGKNFLQGIATLKQFDLAYDILIFPRHLTHAIKFVEKFPEQTFILDHIAKPYIRDKKISPWKEDIEQLAAHPNVYCKVSGMVTETYWNGWKPEDFYPYLDVIFKSFGTNRVMIGSDWPVCKLAGNYSQVLSIVIDYMKDFPEKEKARVLGENAIKAYKLKI